MNKRRIKTLAICMSCIVMILVVEPVRATTISDLEKQKQELEQKRQEADRKRKEEQKKYENASGRVNEIASDAEEVAGEIEEVDAALVETIASVEMMTEEIKEKQEQITVTTAEYEAAKATEEEQYEAMKLRIRFMYEKGDMTYLQILIESQGFGDMVNKVEYVEKLYDYDRKLLEKYQAAREATLILKTKLEEEMSELEAQQQELIEEQESLEEILTEKQAVYDNYEVQLAQAKQEAAIYKANVKKQNEEIRKLEAAAASKQSEIDAAKQAQEQAKKAQEQAFKKQSSSGRTGNYASAASYSGTGSKGQQIANYACQFIGNPYVPGGTSLTEGADCSGFVFRVYKDFGYSVPRTSYSFRSAGSEVAYSNAQPGDVVCYAGHVGIYIGNGQIVHASTQKTGIKITHATYREILSVRRIA